MSVMAHKINLYKETNLILTTEMELKSEENIHLQSKYDDLSYVTQAVQQEVSEYVCTCVRSFYFIFFSEV